MIVRKISSSQQGPFHLEDYEVLPAAGWEISSKFFDYESGLLVVDTSDTNEANWTGNGYGSRFIPTRQYIIDPRTGAILDAEQWARYFSYEPVETISEDRELKLITTRIHEPKRHSDGINEELIELASGKTVSFSQGVAFREKRRMTLMESYYNEIQRRKDEQAKVDALPTLTTYHQQQIAELKDNTVLLHYYSKSVIYQLVYKNTQYHLQRSRKVWNYKMDLKLVEFRPYKIFNRLEEFQERYLKDKNWLLKHEPIHYSPQNYLLKAFVVEFMNQLRFTHDFTFDEYDQINCWESYFYENDAVKPESYKQYCPHCKQEVMFYSRYPKYICSDCRSKKITDEEGRELSFSNIGMSGGLRITYRDGDKVLWEDVSQYEKLCIIEGARFIATEARFGGIVIQAEE